MTGGPGRRTGPYVRLHWSILDEVEKHGLSALDLGVYALALVSSSKYGRDGAFTVRDVARGISTVAARRSLVALEQAGIVSQIDRHTWSIVGYAEDQLTEAAWAKRREDARARQATKRALDAARGGKRDDRPS
jgi:hypothetical protein